MPLKRKLPLVPEPGGNQHAIDLVKQIVALNDGKYLYEEEMTDTNALMGDFV
jgi:hypothetical protein